MTGNMEGNEKTRTLIKSLNNAIDSFDSTFKPFVNKSLDEIIAKDESALEKVKTQNTYCYILISSLFAYLKTSGMNVEAHPIMKELERIKSYMKRHKELEKALSKQDTSKQDIETANNFLQKTLGIKSTGGAAATDNLKKPAISSVNFNGKHTRFKDEDSDSDSDKGSKPRDKKRASASKIGKPSTVKKQKKRKQ